MATIKEATQSAMLFAVGTLGEERARGMRLEEIESASENGVDVWRITFSMDDPLAVMYGRRDYKTFSVVKETGEVASMKIRTLAGS